MEIGLLIGSFTWRGGAPAIRHVLARIARDAEQAGVSSIWLNDHFLQIPAFGKPEDPVLEAYTGLAFLAGVTERVELGTLTTGATHRHPGPLLKMVTTLDVLSGGRFWFGVGPPWYVDEQRAMGIPVLEWPERFARLEELLRLARQVWAGDDSPYAGEHYQLARPLFSPPPLRPPPILVGGAHERRLLPLVARYADACNFFEDGGVDLLRLKLSLLAKRCAEIGRPFEEIRKTSFGTLRLSRTGHGPAQTVAEAVERFHRLAELGVSLAIVDLADADQPDAFELLADVVTAVASFG